MSLLLRALSLAWRPACALKAGLFRLGWRKPRSAPLPVVSVGNIALGGSGKTPVVVEIIAWAEARGLKPAVVTRGYKGLWEKKGGVLSDGTALRGGWREAGDEPAMIARRFPRAGVFVGRRRLLSCRKARDAGFDFAILDDGFQHLKLGRDLDIVLFQPGLETALREGSRSLRRAGIVLLEAGRNASLPFDRLGSRPLVFSYRIRPEAAVDIHSGSLSPLESLRGKKAVAVCGIARPGRFFGLLDGLGLEVAARLSFPDHYDYPPRALSRIASACARHHPDAVLTTEKDAVKFADRVPGPCPIPCFAVRIGVELPPAFFEALAPVAGRARHDHA